MNINQITQWLRRSGRLEISLLLAGLVVIIGAWMFAALAGEVLEGDTLKYDDRILLALRKPGNLAEPIGPVWLLQIARDLTAMGGVSVLSIVCAVVAGYLLLRRHYGRLIFTMASVVSGTLIALVFKEVFHRPRPQIVPHLTDISTASFPSGHSMISSVTYLTLAALLARSSDEWRLKVYFLVVAVVLIVLIGCSRVFLGVHFPTDVLAGWCAGITWAIACCLVGHLLEKRRMV